MLQGRPLSSLLTSKFRKRAEEDSRVFVPIIAREPVPLEREKSSLAHLPDHVVRHIFNYAQESSTEDILTVALLSSSLYGHARYVQHRVVHIDLNESRQTRNRLDLIVCRNLLPAIRILKVSGRDRDELADREETLIRLADMLLGMTGLRDLDWDVGEKTAVPIPISILKSLPFHMRLHTRVICEESAESHSQGREFLAYLANNRNLFTLSVRVWFITELECLKTMQALKKVLLSCPNLVRLPLIDVGYPGRPPHGIMDGPGLGAPYCGLGLSGVEKPAPLEELGIQFYPWGHERRQAQEIYAEGYPEKGLEWDYWANTFDWSQLLRLNDIPCEVASVMLPKLVSLKEMVVADRCYAWDKTTFLNEIPSTLELLSIPSWEHVGYKPDSIIRHGTQLRRLEVHRAEHMPYHFVTDQDLVQLCDGLPRLEELAIDIARDENTNDWPYGALDAIARFPRLRTVELWFQLGYGRDPAPTPFVTVSSASYLFGYLCKRSKSIQRLILHSGAPSSLIMTGPYTRDKPFWAMQNSVTLVCNMAYEGNAKGGVLSVTCPNLSNELNRKLARLSRGEGDGIILADLDVKELPLKTALDGPLTMAEWEDWQHQRWTRWRKAHREQTTMLGKLAIRPSRRVWEKLKKIASIH
ncbi:hypothetical protein F4820DRAFT_243761 [Hypoxylon rubiginosum]|uniref:Uncharacterized protein n=1 Tax=Hypoxylon rubiginosum TaxID=110542 RepID=A0ACB9Z4U5_9PEZI|nr:hypothetical protein F4820DRAFT_243761 [Hypoxylon rubiginosum]